MHVRLEKEAKMGSSTRDVGPIVGGRKRARHVTVAGAFDELEEMCYCM